MTKKFPKEMPMDLRGQRTTAVPIDLVSEAEWSTPVTVLNTEALRPTVTLSDLQVVFPELQNVSDIGALDKLTSLEQKIDSLLKRSAKEPFSGSVTVDKTFTQEMVGFVISNDGNVGDSNLTFEVNGDIYTVMPGEVWDDYLEPFTGVLVTTTVPFRAYGRG